MHQKRMEDVIAMKKLTVAMMAVVALAMVPSASWALPPVQLAGDCSYANDIDMWSTNAIPALDLGESYEVSDLDADGVPDKFQFGMLGAVLCAGDPLVLGQWTDNSEAIGVYLATMNAFNTAEPATGAALAAVAPVIAAFYAAHTAQIGGIPGAPAAFGLLLLGSGPLPNLADLADTLDGAQEITMVLPVFIPYMAAQLGISTESNEALVAVWAEFFGLFPQFGAAMVGYYKPALQGVAGVAALIGDPAFPALAADAAAAAGLANTCGAALASISGDLPTMAIYGVSGKAAGDPFSGLGDYNGNGDTNKDVYDGVVAGGGDRGDFVARASGAEVFYAGNPALPVAGILGLALLAGACVMGGAASIRRK